MLAEKAKVIHRGPYTKHNSDEERRAAAKRYAQKYNESHKELCRARNQAYFSRPEVKARVKARRLMRELEKQFDEVRSDPGEEVPS